jgi:hypothetical protein
MERAPDQTGRKELFVEKVSRSIAELQSNVNSLADVTVFLEVLGYNDNDAKREGFADIFDLAGHVYQSVEYYDEASGGESEVRALHAIPVPSTRKRLVESLSLATPWLGGLALLYAFGVSLWLALGLPIEAVTALMIGVFLGLLISEGPLQAFTRMFMFYQAQGNVSECSRVLKRSYVALTMLLTGAVAVLLMSTYLLGIPLQLAGLAAVGAVTISLHRIGYLPIFANKNTRAILISYGIALPLLVGVYFLGKTVFPDLVIRYLVSLSAALSVLSVFAWYHSTKSLVVRVRSVVEKDLPSFYRSSFINEYTIRSNFTVQFWEALPQYLFGTFFFMMVFSDRVLSWMANPAKTAAGVLYPMLFNPAYHAGADLALGIMFPVAIVQYVMLSSIHEELHNLSVEYRVTQTKRVDSFLRRKHRTILRISVSVSAAAALVLVLLGPYEITRLGGSMISVQVLYIAACADLLLVVFVVNSSFLMLLNRPKTLVVMSLCGALIVFLLGVYLMPLGFQYLVYAYLAGCGAVAVASLISVVGLLARSPSSLFYSRFI